MPTVEFSVNAHPRARGVLVRMGMTEKQRLTAMVNS